MFSVVNSVLLRPLPYHDPYRLVQITHSAQVAGISTVDQSDASQHSVDGFQAVGAQLRDDVPAAIGGV